MSGLNKNDIIRMAKEAGGYIPEQYPDELRIDTDDLARFVALVAAAEREACAKVCDEQEKRSNESRDKSKRERDQSIYHHCAITAKWNAESIRARGQE